MGQRSCCAPPVAEGLKEDVVVAEVADSPDTLMDLSVTLQMTSLETTEVRKKCLRLPAQGLKL